MSTHDTHESHSTRFYWIVAGVLAVVTIIEVFISVAYANWHILSPALAIGLLLVLSVVKGAGVVMFFMHLRGDARIFQFVFIVPFLFATTMLLMFLLLFSQHVGIAG